MKKQIEKLLRVGIYEDLSFSERLRVELSNQLVVLGVPLLALHLLLNILTTQNKIEYIVSAVWFCILGSMMLLNQKRHYNLARYIVLIIGITMVGFVNAGFGKNAGLESMYLLFIVISIYFFPLKKALKIICYIIGLFIAAYMYSSYYPQFLGTNYNEAGPLSYFLFVILIIVSLTTKVLREIQLYNILILKKNEDLTVRNEQLERFNHILSHDLKEPIRSMVSFSEILRKKIKEDSPHSEYIDFIANSGRQLNELVEGIRVYQLIDDIPIKKQEVNVQELVDAICNDLKQNDDYKAVQVICSEIPKFDSSEGALQLVLRQLIDNGIKYNHADFPKVEVRGFNKEDKTILEIKDNGIGIDKNLTDQAFVMFKRLNSSFSKGAGLGLNIAQKMVKKLDGDLKIIHSESGKGTTMQIVLPQK